MLVLEGILINVFETPKGVTKDGKEYGGESKIQVMYENTLANGEKRTEMETLTVTDTSYLGKKNALCAFLWLFKRVSGKGVFRQRFERILGDAELTRRTPNGAKSAVFGAHILIHGLKALIPCWAWVSRGSRF